MKIQAKKAPGEPDTMISLDNRTLLVWHRTRQDVALPTTQRTTSEEMETFSPVKDAMVRRECSTSILELRL